MLVVQRWILARLRHHRCFSLAEVNQCIAGLLEDLNNRPFKQLPGSRRSAFEALDKPALRPLPRYFIGNHGQPEITDDSVGKPERRKQQQ